VIVNFLTAELLLVFASTAVLGSEPHGTHDYTLPSDGSGNFQTPVGQSVKLLLDFASTVIPGFSLLEIHDQDFCSLQDMHMF
jgi:hypothetical protein